MFLKASKAEPFRNITFISRPSGHGAARKSRQEAGLGLQGLNNFARVVGSVGQMSWGGKR